MKIIWTDEALKGLSEIEEYIARDSRKRADTFSSYLIERTVSITQNPEIGRIVPEISNHKIRELIVKNYRIVYKIAEKRIEVLTVFEGHKLLIIDEVDV